MSITEFQKLSFNGKSSVVRCRPYTGRTHQIRAHLQYLGYPILNDPLYNSYAFGPEKGKHGVFHKNVDELMEDLINKHLKRMVHV
ncbi:RNA pseudouridylate synthase domain-containing protein 2 [Caerostris extrusa]|uniref:RNA pseudouridylate synthase domain-containing protein 2 n=1 Tax=Caerostris extrusa TaxID=172846 RepID=A0AAV4SR15_CAEEX|nr:RNA pseudouridylate synthase domain-containing protein 2 [Caerostris extrusa]